MDQYKMGGRGCAVLRITVGKSWHPLSGWILNLFVNQIDNALIQLSSITVLVWLPELRLLIFENVGFIGLFKKKYIWRYLIRMQQKKGWIWHPNPSPKALGFFLFFFLTNQLRFESSHHTESTKTPKKTFCLLAKIFSKSAINKINVYFQNVFYKLCPPRTPEI